MTENKKTDIDKLLKDLEHDFAYVKDCSRSKAYSIRKRLEAITAPNDRFVELKYDSETRIARYELVS